MTERACAERLFAQLLETGATPVEAPFLLPADTLLDLYGEDIRNRTYITSDALRGEQMLRPDFTVPVVQAHMTTGATPARYAYCGEVFRKQEEDPNRPTTYFQVGYEVFDDADPAAADAEVFAQMTRAVAHLDVTPKTGDIGILIAAVTGLRTTDARKVALMRHLWRPARFRALLDRYAGRVPMPEHRARLIAGTVTTDAPQIGLRSADDIQQRIDALRADAAAPPISVDELDGLSDLIRVHETLPYALERLRDISGALPQVSDAVERLARRTDAMAAAGIDVEALAFEASYGRATMEYYDGFVFGLMASNRPDLPAIASGGRYDALTHRLGNGAAIPAVGGVLRPGLIAQLEEAS